MKIKFGALVVAGRGKIGGHVASRNRAGAYLRTKVTPVNPQSTAQTTVRNRLASISSGWKALTADQRSAWIGAVGDFAKTDVFGDLKNPSGFNLYQRLNNNLVTVGASQLTLPPAPAEVLTVTIGTLTAAVTGSVLTLALSAAVPAGTSMKIFATNGVSAGVNFVKSEYRLITVAAPAATSPVDLEAAYVAVFGTKVATTKVFVRIEFVNETTGQSSAGQSASDIVAA